VHELAHAWQFGHRTPGFAELWEQIKKPFLTTAQHLALYDIQPIDGRPWASYATEQQAEVVAQWYEGNFLDLDGPDALRHPLFPYIQNHIRLGRA
jgi:hypothetical protein